MPILEHPLLTFVVVVAFLASAVLNIGPEILFLVFVLIRCVRLDTRMT